MSIFSRLRAFNFISTAINTNVERQYEVHTLPRKIIPNIVFTTHFSYMDSKKNYESLLQQLLKDTFNIVHKPLICCIIKCTAQQNTTPHNTTQHNTTQHNTTQHNTTQHNTTQHNTTQHNTTQHNTTQHNNTTQHKMKAI